MTDIDPTYAAGLASDGLVRFVDSTGDAWLIPIEDEDGGTDGGRNIIDLADADAVYAKPGAYDRYDRALDEYLASLVPKPELPTEIGAMIRVKEVTEDVSGFPLGLYEREDESDEPWATLSTRTRTHWLRDDQIAQWNPVDIVDREA